MDPKINLYFQVNSYGMQLELSIQRLLLCQEDLSA